MSNNRLASSIDVFNWPEFELFAKRLGVNIESPIRVLTINLDVEDVAIVKCEHYGVDDSLESQPNQ